ncbi:MAG: PGAP1-like protein [Solirubrobacterales bacterium]|nr:PGAP1-like protein [Solirubrobacterales bacterium]
MRSDEAHAIGSLAADGIGGATARAHELHRAIASRVFGALGPETAPIQAAHEALSSAIYTGVRVAGGAGGRLAGVVVAATRPADAPALLDNPGAGFAVGALNGILGDRLYERDSALALPMTVRVDGHDVPLTPDAIAAAHPDPTGRVAVFLHGLCETEASWKLGTAREDAPPLPTYAERLQEDLGLSPVLVRYNSGRRISDNGRELARLLHELVTHWPGEVRDLVLIGHSMGGLIIRSACHVAEGAERPWRRQLTHVVMLGTPHLGAPLEQQVNHATRIMRRIPEAVPVAAVLDVRSAGIRDLRFGAITDSDWSGHEPDHFSDPCGDVPLLTGVRHCTICATLTARHDAPVGRIFGDLLVTHSSATGAGRRRKIAFSAEDTVHIGGMNHFALLNHPRVYEQLHDWLAADRPDVPALGA